LGFGYNLIQAEFGTLWGCFWAVNGLVVVLGQRGRYWWLELAENGWEGARKGGATATLVAVRVVMSERERESLLAFFE